MKQEQYPFLTALEARGSFARMGEPLSNLVVEVRGGRLFITGVTPLRDDGDRYTETGSAYSYELEGAEAEKLLSALSHDFKGRPEAAIAREFEFSRLRCPLKEYLDSLQINYQYYFTKGDPL
jgi:hypothetical protein